MMPVDASWAQFLSLSLGAGHAQRHHDVAVLLDDELLARHRQILDPRNGVPDDAEPGAHGLQLVRGGPAHVHSGEGGVGDPDKLH